MIGIREIASYIPETSLDNFKLAATFGENEDFVKKRLGGYVLPIIGPGMDTSDMAVHVIQRLLKKTSIAKEDIQCLVICTQNPDGGGLPHTSAIVQEKADLPNRIAAFDISLGCSGYVYGLNIVKGFMEASGLSNGILITADPYSKIVDPEDRNTKMLFGDAATATLLSRENPVFTIGKSSYSTDGKGAVHLRNRNGRLDMNGRQVFNFAATKVPQQIDGLLAAEGLAHADIDQYIFHQGSRYIVETLTQRMRIDKKKVPIQMENTGNTVSSSIPLILENTITNEAIRNILVSGFGVGWSWGSLILVRS